MTSSTLPKARAHFAEATKKLRDARKHLESIPDEPVPRHRLSNGLEEALAALARADRRLALVRERRKKK